MASLNSLPVELLHLICDYLTSKDVLQLMLTNRGFNMALRSNLLQNVIIREPKNLQHLIGVIHNGRQGTTPFGSQTRSLKLTNSPISASQLLTLLNNFPNVAELDLDSTTWRLICPRRQSQPWNPRNASFRQYLSLTFTSYTQLTSLSLNLTGYMAQSIDIHQLLPLLSGLQELKLINAINIFTMDHLEHIHNFCPKLVDLFLSGYCLNRARAPLPITPNSTLQHLTFRFSSGWTYYYNWLWYIGHKYTGLTSVVCESISGMGIRSANASDEEDSMEGFTVFAQRHALTLKTLHLINLTIDYRLVAALQSSSMINTQTVMDSALQPKAITSARFSSNTTFIKPEIFMALLHYVHETIRTLNISWPRITVIDQRIFTSLAMCVHLTDLTIELPSYIFGFAEIHGTVHLDQILISCPMLITMRIIHGKLVVTDDTVANHTQNYPLKSLALESVYIPTSFLVMENHGLINIEYVYLNHCVIYGLTTPSIADRSVLVDWIFPIPAPPTDDDPTMVVPRRPLSLNLFHTHFINPGFIESSLLCDFISLSQHGKQEESWNIRSRHVQKMERLTSPMLRRKSGQMKRNINRRQTRSEYSNDVTPVPPAVGILISCYALDSLYANNNKLI